MKRNIYVFAGEGYMVRESFARLKASLDIQMEELNVTVFGEMPPADLLIETCAAVPFLSPVRLVAVRDCTALTAAGDKDEAKKIADFLEQLPDTGAGAVRGHAPDKRQLYKRAAKLGTVRGYRTQSGGLSASWRSRQRQGAHRRAAARGLSTWWGTVVRAGQRVAKLAVYSGGKRSRRGVACVARCWVQRV